MSALNEVNKVIAGVAYTPNRYNSQALDDEVSTCIKNSCESYDGVIKPQHNLADLLSIYVKISFTGKKFSSELLCTITLPLPT